VGANFRLGLKKFPHSGIGLSPTGRVFLCTILFIIALVRNSLENGTIDSMFIMIIFTGLMIGRFKSIENIINLFSPPNASVPYSLSLVATEQ